jgi:tetratricopeptide (TPR) repeat protein/TolB-like protein
LRHDRRVAIKVLHPELAAAVGGQRFLHEIKTVASLNHPHVLMLIDSGEADGLLYYVMPYAEGESLRQRLDREKQLPVDESVRIAVEVADGLDYAHRTGVVHRDIKPGNILLSERHAVIADFGIARAIEAAKGERVTSTGLGVGTPLYASPEQATGEETLDGRTDIYSLACVLYEMLAGEPPLTGATPQMIQARRMSETPTALHALRETVPPELDSVIACALARVPADRYATAAQFGRALQAVLMGRTPGADVDLAVTPALEVTAPPAAPKPERRGSRTARWLVAVAGLVVVAAVATVVWMQAADGDEGQRGVRVPVGATDLGPHSVAVLPLANDTGEDSLDWLGPGLASMLTTDLTQLDSLRVVGNERVRDLMRQAGFEATQRTTTDQALSIGARSGAHTVVRGSFDKPGDDYHVTVQLIDLADSTVIGSEQASGTEVLVLVDSLSAVLAGRVLGDSISPSDLTPLSRITTGNMEAYRAYRDGRHERAVALDSTFALAWLQVALAHYGAYDYPASTLAIQQAKRYSADVTNRDRLLIEAHEARCDERYDEAIGRMEELVTTYPDEKRGRLILSIMYRNQGRLENQQRVLYEVLWLDPNHAGAINELAYTAARLGDAVRADTLSRRYMELSPKDWNAYDSRAEILEMLGRTEEARVMYREAIRLNPSRWGGYANLAGSYLDADDPTGGRAALAEFVGGEDPDGQIFAHWLIADTYVSEGRYREALDPLRRASENTIDLGKEYEYASLPETGVHALAVGEFESAEESFWKVIHTDFFRRDALFGLMATYGRQGRFDEMSRVRDTVAADIGAMPEPARETAGALLLMSDGLIAWYRAGDAEETVRLIREARDVVGLPRTRWRPEMGVEGEEILALIQMGRASDALELISSMERLPERDYYRLLAHTSWYLRGRAYEALGETERALQSYGQLFDVAGDGVREITLFQDTPERLARLSAGLGAEP